MVKGKMVDVDYNSDRPTRKPEGGLREAAPKRAAGGELST